MRDGGSKDGDIDYQRSEQNFGVLYCWGVGRTDTKKGSISRSMRHLPHVRSRSQLCRETLPTRASGNQRTQKGGIAVSHHGLVGWTSPHVASDTDVVHPCTNSDKFLCLICRGSRSGKGRWAKSNRAYFWRAPIAAVKEIKGRET